MSVNKFWKWLPYYLLGAYVVLIAVLLHQLNSRMDYILSSPVRVTHEAVGMIARLREMQYIMPGLLSTPNLSPEKVENILERQEDWQDRAMDVIREAFNGDPALIHDVEQKMTRVRQLRREATAKLAYNDDYNTSMEYYRGHIVPQVNRLYNSLKTLSDVTKEQISASRLAMEERIRIGMIATLATGIIIAFAFFMTQQREEEKTRQLEQHDNLFNQLSHNVDDIFIIASGSEHFDFVSPNSKRLIGIREEQILSDPGRFYAFMPEDDANWLKKKLDRPNDRTPAERDIVVENGERFFKLTISYIHDNTRQGGYIVVLRDQTKDAKYKQALNAALDNAHIASQAKSSFLSRMSHEIRTPMNAIIGMTTIALSRQDNPERVGDCLLKIAESSRHLLGLINDVLDMSKIENGKLSITNEPFSLPRSIQSINDLVRPQAVSRQLNFEIAQENVDKEELVGDALRLNQILINILSNALKFTPPGGTISLTIQQIARKRDSVHMRFVIEDTGIGMSEEFLKRLYEPFEQATQTTAAKYGGTGLGMSITLNLCTLMGGTIQVESQEGKGSKFIVELPFGYKESAAARSYMLPPLRVLICDCDSGTCEHASLILDKMGLSTRWCTSGQEAVQLVKEASAAGSGYDVCIIDWKMPEMDGAETARRIRAVVGDDMLIIIISAYDWNPIEQEARSFGVNDFIPKPFFASTLYDVLARAAQKLGGERARGQERAENDKYDFSNKRILLAEDNEFNREIANEFLDMVHAQVENAENGQEAVDKFKAAPAGYYDLILMDVQMPQLNGYEATKAIRASDHPDAKDIHIVAMTANAFSEDVAEAVRSGMNGHIAKPIDVNELYHAIKTHAGAGKVARDRQNQ